MAAKIDAVKDDLCSVFVVFYSLFPHSFLKIQIDSPMIIDYESVFFKGKFEQRTVIKNSA